MTACGCGHALTAHDETGECLEWWRYPDVLTARQCGCVSPWTRPIPPEGGLPDCEGWVCQSCGADNFIPAGFTRIPPGKP